MYHRHKKPTQTLAKLIPYGLKKNYAKFIFRTHYLGPSLTEFVSIILLFLLLISLAYYVLQKNYQTARQQAAYTSALTILEQGMEQLYALPFNTLQSFILEQPHHYYFLTDTPPPYFPQAELWKLNPYPIINYSYPQFTLFPSQLTPQKKLIAQRTCKIWINPQQPFLIKIYQVIEWELAGKKFKESLFTCLAP